MVLKVIPLSSLLKTHWNVSPGIVGGGLPGVNDMLTCMHVQICRAMMQSVSGHMHACNSSLGIELTLFLTQIEEDQT